MRISKPLNCKPAGDRQFTCEFDVEDRRGKRRVFAHITWEAITGEASRHVTDAEMAAALETLRMDPHHSIANAMAEHLEKGEPGDAGLPVAITSLSFDHPK